MILMPLPDRDFDPSETAIPWKILTENRLQVVFATPYGNPGLADMRMVTGEGLGVWKRLLAARKDALADYGLMLGSHEFNNPIKYAAIDSSKFSGMILPGGHAPGMKTYLESIELQKVIVDFFKRGKPVGAICHGVVLVSRSIDPDTGKSVIHEYKTTALLKMQELSAYYLTFSRLGNYYRTYPDTVEDEVKSKLSDSRNFLQGNWGIFRDKTHKLKHGFTVTDRNFLSARWPGDAHRFANDFVTLLGNSARKMSGP